MFSDTHFHFSYIFENLGAEESARMLSAMAEYDTYFAMDIGTHCDDLKTRADLLASTVSLIKDESLREKARDFLFLSAGIWPDKDAILDRENQMKVLEKSISDFIKSGHEFSGKLCAIGEGGLDHHWNPSGVDGRCESDFDAAVFEGERELFLMQLALAKKMNLPFICHSRDAYEGTLEAIKESGVTKGIIHCYSYGKDEARSFLDLGWHISLSGSITYAKKSKLEAMKEMISFIPEERLLMETDAPYLAPVPERGKMNTPLFIKNTYAFAAEARGLTTEALCELVDRNIKNLFELIR